MQIVVNNVLVNYQEVGIGPTLVCVHGWMHSLDSFTQLTDELKVSYRIIALDLPNFGKSGDSETIISISDYSRFLAAFVDKLTIQEYTLVGHSMGGQIALAAVGDKILDPEKLVLIGSAGVRDNRKIYKTFLKLASKAVRPIVPKRIKIKFYKFIGSDYNPNLSEVHKRIIHKTLETDVQALAENIQQPTLLIYGSDDVSTPPAMGKKLAGLISHSKLELIHGERHWPHQSAAPKVAKLIREFLK